MPSTFLWIFGIIGKMFILKWSNIYHIIVLRYKLLTHVFQFQKFSGMNWCTYILLVCTRSLKKKFYFLNWLVTKTLDLPNGIKLTFKRDHCFLDVFDMKLKQCTYLIMLKKWMKHNFFSNFKNLYLKAEAYNGICKYRSSIFFSWNRFFFSIAKAIEEKFNQTHTYDCAKNFMLITL